jgi:hypothetical protein
MMYINNLEGPTGQFAKEMFYFIQGDVLVDCAKSLVANYLVIEPSRVRFRQYMLDLAYVKHIIQNFLIRINKALC